MWILQVEPTADSEASAVRIAYDADAVTMTMATQECLLYSALYPQLVCLDNYFFYLFLFFN